MERLKAHRRLRWLAPAGLVLAVALTVGGAASASIPDGSGTIHGCYSTNGSKATNGAQLNIVDSDLASCSKGQQGVTWNAKSPDSFAASGQTCSTGTFAAGIDSTGNLVCGAPPRQLPRVVEATQTDSVDFKYSQDFVTLLSVTVPTSGTYLVSAKVSLYVGDGNRAQCELRRSGESQPFDRSFATLEEYGFTSENSNETTIPLQSVTAAVAGNTISFGCYALDDSDNSIQASYAKLDALQVTTG